jgi:amino acid transporter
MARRLRSAGGFYAFVSAGLGRVPGLGTASMVTTAYAVFTASLIGAFAYFTSTTIESWTGTSIPVWALLVGALVVNLAFAYFEVRITARVLGAFFVAELTGLLVFAVVVLVQGGAEGLTAAPLNPLAILDNQGAIAVFGTAAPGIALYSAFSSWLGFEMAPSYSEETQSRRGIAWVTLGALLAMAVVYVLVSYAFVVGHGLDGAARARSRRPSTRSPTATRARR